MYVCDVWCVWCVCVTREEAARWCSPTPLRLWRSGCRWRGRWWRPPNWGPAGSSETWGFWDSTRYSVVVMGVSNGEGRGDHPEPGVHSYTYTYTHHTCTCSSSIMFTLFLFPQGSFCLFSSRHSLLCHLLPSLCPHEGVLCQWGGPHWSCRPLHFRLYRRYMYVHVHVYPTIRNEWCVDLHVTVYSPFTFSSCGSR